MAGAFDQLARAIDSEMVKAVGLATTKLKSEAVRRSSGPFKTPELRRRGHPYATRHGPLGNVAMQPAGGPGVINVQSGTFRSAWTADRPRVTDGGRTISGRVSNQSEVADILKEGTPVMIPRPIERDLEQIGVVLLEREVQDAMRRLESRHGR